MDARIEETIKNLKRRGFEPYYLESRAQVLPLVQKLVPAGSSVSHGGSETLKEVGVIDLLSGGDYQYINRAGLEGEALRQCYQDAFGCDAYFTSSNAITTDGVLYNVDGNSNRVACIVFGPRQVIMIVGRNKIVDTFDQAVERVKRIAVPATPSGSIARPLAPLPATALVWIRRIPALCDGCFSPQRVCCNYVTTAFDRHIGRIKVLIVDEELGY